MFGNIHPEKIERGDKIGQQTTFSFKTLLSCCYNQGNVALACEIYRTWMKQTGRQDTEPHLWSSDVLQRNAE